jgi:hypothetical protein
MGGVLKLFGKTHYIDRLKGTFLYTDTTSNTELFGDGGYPVVIDDYRFVTRTYTGAVLDAFKPAFFGMAPFPMNNSDMHEYPVRIEWSE